MGVAGEGSGLIGWVRGRSEGPLLLCVGGLHGNEPAGVSALRQVIDEVRARQGVLRGDFVAVVGNVAATEAGRRFLSYDLNRAWTPDRVRRARVEAALRNGAPAATRAVGAGPSAPGIAGRPVARAPGGASSAPRPPEDAEVVRMLAVLDQVEARRRGPVHVLDLHTTSGLGGTFTTTADESGHRRFAMAIPFPLVLGIDQHLRGTLLDHVDALGYTSAVCECGQHREAHSVFRARAATWLAIRAAGILPADAAPEATSGRLSLQRERSDLPGIFEMVHRHPVHPGDGYRTRPGLSNFQPVGEGDLIGRDRSGEVRSPADGLLLMPLYQELGEDGFFVIRPAAGQGAFPSPGS